MNIAICDDEIEIGQQIRDFIRRRKEGCRIELVVSLLKSFKVFREVYLVGGAYPQENIYLLQHIFNNWYTNLDFDKMAAGRYCPQ